MRFGVGWKPVGGRLKAWVRARAPQISASLPCLAARLHACLAAWLSGCLAAWLPGCLATVQKNEGCLHRTPILLHSLPVVSMRAWMYVRVSCFKMGQALRSPAFRAVPNAAKAGTLLPEHAPKRPQGGPKMAPRLPQDAPRWPQDGPERPQEAPK